MSFTLTTAIATVTATVLTAVFKFFGATEIRPLQVATWGAPICVAALALDAGVFLWRVLA